MRLDAGWLGEPTARVPYPSLMLACRRDTPRIFPSSGVLAVLWHQAVVA
jgi:hypothetical protein